jgi:hypothetical protein
MKHSATDVARAARFASALSAEDETGATAILREAQQDNGLAGFSIALGVRLVQICSEYYDVDRQRILDMFAMEALTYAEESE